jgi:hypothetical protein
MTLLLSRFDGQHQSADAVQHGSADAVLWDVSSYLSVAALCPLLSPQFVSIRCVDVAVMGREKAGKIGKFSKV